MAVLDRYILKQISRPLLASLLIALLVFLVARMLGVLDLVLGSRGHLATVIEILGYLIPHYLGVALPLSLFLGVFLVFSRLSRESELDVMFSSGVGLVRLVAPVLVGAIAVTVAVAILLGHLQPLARYAYRLTVHTVSNVSFHRLLQDGVFTTLRDTTYMVEHIAPNRQDLERVFIHTRSDAGDSLVVTAHAGTVIREAATDPITLKLQQGIQQMVRPPDAGGDTPSAVTIRFREFESSLSDSTPDAFGPRGGNERELTIPELWRLQGTALPDVEPHEMTAELHARLVRIVSILALPFLAIPLALGRRRGQRSYGLAVGIVILVTYNQVIHAGEALVDNGRIGPWPVLWLPFAIYATGALALFFFAALRVRDTGSAGLGGWIAGVFAAITGKRTEAGATIP
jgi:lipopolysaccharide export system permease protein